MHGELEFGDAPVLREARSPLSSVKVVGECEGYEVRFFSVILFDLEASACASDLIMLVELTTNHSNFE